MAPVFASTLGGLLPTLVDWTAKSVPVLLAGCIAALLLRRRSAALRHLVWVLSVAVIAALPVFSVSLPGWNALPAWINAAQPLNSDVGSRVNRSASTRLGDDRRIVDGDRAPRRETTQRHRETESLSAVRKGSEKTEAVFSGGWMAQSLIVLVWLTISASLLLRVLLSWLFLRRHAVASRSVSSGAFREMADDLAKRLGVPRPVRILLCPRDFMPLSWGVLRPTVMLPSSGLWSGTRLRSVMLHELGHLRRRDPAVELLVQVVCAMYWCNPLVWVAAWRIRVERERACDNLVLHCGERASEYAQHLLDVVTHCARVAPAGPGVVAMARNSQFQRRVRDILNERLRRDLPSRKVLLSSLLLSLVGAASLAMLRASDEAGTERADEKPNLTLKLIDKASPYPVSGAKVSVYPGGKDKGLNNKHVFISDAKGLVTIPPIEFKPLNQNDYATVVVNYLGQVRSWWALSAQDLGGGLAVRENPFNIELRPANNDFQRWQGRRKYLVWMLDPGGQWRYSVPSNVAPAWGEEVHGLKATVIFAPYSYGYPMGEGIATWLIIRNSSQNVIRFSSEAIRRDDTLTVRNAHGEEVFRSASANPASSVADSVKVKLKPGEEVAVGSIGFRVGPSESASLQQAWLNVRVGDICRAKLTMEIRDVEIRDDSGNPIVPPDGDRTVTLTSGEMEFLITAASDQAEPEDLHEAESHVRGQKLPDDVLRAAPWGPLTDGLSAAVVLDPKEDGYSIGEQVERRFLIRNRSKSAIRFTTSTWLQDARPACVDEDDAEIHVRKNTYTGAMRFAHFTLSPGEAVQIEGPEIGIGKGDYKYPVGDVVHAEPGQTCLLSYALKIPVAFSFDPDGRVRMPAKGDWEGTLKTGQARFKVKASVER